MNPERHPLNRWRIFGPMAAALLIVGAWPMSYLASPRWEVWVVTDDTSVSRTLAVVSRSDPRRKPCNWQKPAGTSRSEIRSEVRIRPTVDGLDLCREETRRVYYDAVFGL